MWEAGTPPKSAAWCSGLQEVKRLSGQHLSCGKCGEVGSRNKGNLESCPAQESPHPVMTDEEELWGERCWARKGKGKWKAATWDTSSSRLYPPDDLGPLRTRREEATDCRGEKASVDLINNQASRTLFAIRLLLWQKVPCAAVPPREALPGKPHDASPLPAWRLQNVAPPPSISSSGQALRPELHWAAGEGGGPGSIRELWLALPRLVEASSEMLSDLSPLPVLEGLGLSQLQKKSRRLLSYRWIIIGPLSNSDCADE